MEGSRAFTSSFDPNIFEWVDIYCNTLTEAAYEDVKIIYERKGSLVDILFLPKKNNIYLEIYNGSFSWDENGGEKLPKQVFDQLEVLKGHEIPLRPKGHVALKVTYCILDDNTILDESNGQFVKYTDDQVINISFIDTTKVVKLKDLYKKQ